MSVKLGDVEVAGFSGGGSIDAIDDITITKNNIDEIQAVAVVDQNTGIVKTWTGTMAEYEAIVTKDPDTEYIITDDIGDSAVNFRREVAERNIGEVVYSTIPITDAGLHLADGDLLDGTGIYKDFYEYMVGVYDAGHTSIFTTEEDWQNQYTNNNHICGKYVLNTTNRTIRLPSIWGWLEGVRDELKAGTYLPPGLPNITGSFSNSGMSGYTGNTNLSGDGVFQTQSKSGWYSKENGGASTTANGTITFDASRSSSVYGTQTTDAVQPRGVQVLIYIVIANTVKTPVQVDIDNIATELNACYGHRVIEFQAPTADNGYTWYRKYADGWVEQGGMNSYGTGTTSNTVIQLLVPMASSRYDTITSAYEGAAGSLCPVVAKPMDTSTATTLEVLCCYSDGGTLRAWGGRFTWRVSGMAATN